MRNKIHGGANPGLYPHQRMGKEITGGKKVMTVQVCFRDRTPLPLHEQMGIFGAEPPIYRCKILKVMAGTALYCGIQVDIGRAAEGGDEHLSDRALLSRGRE